MIKLLQKQNGAVFYASQCSIRIVHKVHTKSSKHDNTKTVNKYTKTQCKKEEKNTQFTNDQNRQQRHTHIYIVHV